MTPAPADPHFPSRFHVAVDVVALTISPAGLLQVAVVQRHGATSCIADPSGRVREVPRESNDFALPGGHVEWTSESLVDAACRELAEETGIVVDPEDLVQLGAYGDPRRDPRSGRTVSVAFVAFKPGFEQPVAGSDAHRAQFIDVIDLLAAPHRFEFDHGRMLRHAIARVRDMMERTPIALNFCGEEFLLSDLRRVYEVLFADAYDPGTDVQPLAEELRRRRAIADRFSQSIGELHSGAPPDGPRRDERVHALFMAPSLERLDIGLRPSTRARIRAAAADTGWGDPRAERRSTDSGNRWYDEATLLPLDSANFARKIAAIKGFVVETQTTHSTSNPDGTKRPGRPGRLYRRGPLVRLEPPLVVKRRSSTSMPMSTAPSS